MGRLEGHLVQVEIYGQSYNLRGEGESGYIQDLASYVDRKMREVSEATATVDSLKVAILAALNIADESRRGARPDPSIAKGGSDRVSRLIEMLERCFADARA
jgi:cell division protein ZapA